MNTQRTQEVRSCAVCHTAARALAQELTELLDSTVTSACVLQSRATLMAAATHSTAPEAPPTKAIMGTATGGTRASSRYLPPQEALDTRGAATAMTAHDNSDPRPLSHPNHPDLRGSTPAHSMLHPSVHFSNRFLPIPGAPG